MILIFHSKPVQFMHVMKRIMESVQYAADAI